MLYQAVAQLNKKLNAPSDSPKTAGEAALQHTLGAQLDSLQYAFANF